MKVFSCFFLSIACFLTALSQPVIKSFSPMAGPIGTTVVIQGVGFSSAPSANVVYFGPVKAPVTAATATALTVSVPLGATTESLSVTSNNLTAFTNGVFTVTFAGGGTDLTAASFVAQSSLTTGTFPHAVSLADLNGDSKPDLLVSKGSSSSFSIFTNASVPGTLTLNQKIEYPLTGTGHNGSATGDFDGDGQLDLVITTSYNTSMVSVFRNVSTNDIMKFAQGKDYVMDKGPYEVAVGDLNGDGKPDLAVANNGSNKVTLLKNTSVPGSISFSFAAGAGIDAGTNPYGIAIGDLDGDGKPDLVVTNQGTSPGMAVMKNTGSGGSFAFDAPVKVTQGKGVFGIAIQDMDGDGKPDLAATEVSQLVVVRNTSTAGTLSFAPLQLFETGTYAKGVSAGDLDGDGRIDLVTANWMAKSVSVLRNTSVPGTIQFARKADYAVGANPERVLAGDVDGDGRPDILVANSSETYVSVLRNLIGLPDGPVISSFSPVNANKGTTVKIKGINLSGATAVTFGGVPAQSFAIDSASGITAIVGEGASGDVAVTTLTATATLAGFSYYGALVSRFIPDQGTTGTTVTITGTNFLDVKSVAFGGVPAQSFSVSSSTSITAVVGDGATGPVTVTTQSGTGSSSAAFTFVPPVNTQLVPTITSFTPGAGPAGTTVTINGSNFDTAASGNTVFFGAVKATVTAAKASQLQVTVPVSATYGPLSVLAKGLKAYSTQRFVPTFSNSRPFSATYYYQETPTYTGNYPSDVLLKDFNNDGKPDLAAPDRPGNTVVVLRNNRATPLLFFDSRKEYAVGTDPFKLASDDLDGDGKPDLVVLNTNSGFAGSLSVLGNVSTLDSIRFAPRADFSTGSAPISLAIQDISGDGKPDIVVAAANDGLFSVLRNTSTAPGVFSFVRQDFLFSGANQVAVSDLDNDGKADVVVSNNFSNVVSAFRNTSTLGNVSFAAKVDFPTGSFPTGIAAGDLNSDGRADLVVANSSDSTISVFQNLSSPGRIQFAARQNYASASVSVAIADLNGDGMPDVLAGSYRSSQVWVFPNSTTAGSSINLAPRLNYPTNFNRNEVTACDIDGDGIPEIVTANNSYGATILKYNDGRPVLLNVLSGIAGSGATVTIQGRNLDSATAVVFGELPARSFTSVSSTQISAVVGGGTSGPVTVTTPAGTGTWMGFRFLPVITASGAATFCKGQSVVLTSSADSHNQWYKDSTLLSGATAKTFEADSAGLYFVTTTANGITTSSAPVKISLFTVEVPRITLNAAGELQSSSTSGNQWYMNGNLVLGATAQTYRPTQNAPYRVSVTQSGCMSDLSAPYEYNRIGTTINIENNQSISAYPNPVTSTLNLDWNIPGTSGIDVSVTTTKGMQVLAVRNFQRGNTLNLSSLSPGIYLVNIKSSNPKMSKTIKIIRNN